MINQKTLAKKNGAKRTRNVLNLINTEQSSQTQILPSEIRADSPKNLPRRQRLLYRYLKIKRMNLVKGGSKRSRTGGHAVAWNTFLIKNSQILPSEMTADSPKNLLRQQRLLYRYLKIKRMNLVKEWSKRMSRRSRTGGHAVA
jgi:aspartyl-tRNA synthetase